VDYLISTFVVLFVGSASFIAAIAAIEHRKNPPSDH
jgi:hypothetical protein